MNRSKTKILPFATITPYKKCNFLSLAPELLCHLFHYLPLREILLLGMLNKKLSAAVNMHFMLCKEIDFCDSKVLGYMPNSISDEHLFSIMKKCPKLEVVYGFHPKILHRRRFRKRAALSIPGIIESLSLCKNLKKIEMSNLKLLEAVSHHLPNVQIIGHFRNREGCFPPNPSQELKLPFRPRVSSLHLMGVQIPELPIMHELKHLHLHWVRFTRVHPFRSFSAVKLETFVMRHCIGPSLPIRYLPLFVALSFAPALSRLELVRVALPEGLIQRAVEDTWKTNGFRKLRKIVIGECKGVLESDMGLLMIVSSQSLESLILQTSLSKDSLFVSLHYAHADFSRLRLLHLGYTDPFPPKDEVPSDYFSSLGMPETLEVPASLTDSGIRIINQLFPNIRNLTISNCPHLTDPCIWFTEDHPIWQHLVYLTMERCHCIRVKPFSKFVAQLKKIEVIILMNMFREPPRGCSHVGLSAGTGLGLSSAIVSADDEHIGVIDMEDEQLPEEVHVRENGDGVELDILHVLNDVSLPHSPENNPPLDNNHENLYGNLQPSESQDNNEESKMEQDEPPNQSNSSRRSRRNAKSANQKRKNEATMDSNSNSAEKAEYGDGELDSNEKILEPSCSNSEKDIESDSKIPKVCAIHKEDCACNCNELSNEEVPNLQQPSTSKAPRNSGSSSAYHGPMTRHRRQMVSPREENGSSHASSSQKSPRSSQRKRNSLMSHKKNKLGSPFVEDDFVQVLHMKSETLSSLTLISCGISEVVFHNSSALVHFEAQYCSIFKKLKFLHCSPPTKVNVVHCPKLNVGDFLYELLIMEFDKAMLIYIELCKGHTYNVAQTEYNVLYHSAPNSTVAVLHDFGSSIADRGLYRDFLLTMMKLVKQLFDVLQQRMPNAMKLDQGIFTENTASYPWEHNIRRLYSGLSNAKYEIMTNNAILSTVWKEIEQSVQDFLALDPLKLLEFDIADLMELRRAYTKQFIGVYMYVPDANSAQ